jgi:hypothetical protein
MNDEKPSGVEDTVMRPRIAAPSGLSFEDTIMRARFPGNPAADPTPAAEPGHLDLFGFRLSGSDVVVVLDRPAHIGRNPRQPTIVIGAPPRLVRVESPRSEVSGSHVELRQLGTAVVITDLNSTNGSTVVVPGNDARMLRRGESMAVLPGTLIDIGDGNVIEILPLQQVS